MKSVTLFVIIAVSLFLVACGQQAQAPAPIAPVVPEAAPAPEAQLPAAPPSVPQANTTLEGTNAVAGAFGDVNKTTALDVNSVRCDAASKTVTFRFKNNETKDWAMNQQAGWADKTLVNVHVTINNYAANGQVQPVYDGVTLFGKEWPFSKNCGGVEVLKAGSDVLCTVSPVPLKTVTSLSAGTNEIFVESPTSKQIIQFTCT